MTASTFSAEKGRQSGALIEIFTKSGTNRFHGMVSEFHTDNALQARTESENVVPKTVRNDFGGTFGGPLWRIVRFSSAHSSGNGPFKERRWLRTLKLPNSHSTCSGTIQQYRHPILDPGAPRSRTHVQFSECVAGTCELWCIDGRFVCWIYGTVVGTAIVPDSPLANGFQGHLRLDHNMRGGNDKLFFSFFRNTTDGTTADGRPKYSYTNPNATLYAKIDYIHTFSPHLVNEVGVSYIRNVGSQSDVIPSLPNIYYIGGISDTFSQWGPSSWAQNNYIYSDDLNWTHGRHSVHVGLDVDRQQDMDNFENGARSSVLLLPQSARLGDRPAVFPERTDCRPEHEAGCA